MKSNLEEGNTAEALHLREHARNSRAKKQSWERKSGRTKSKLMKAQVKGSFPMLGRYHFRSQQLPLLGDVQNDIFNTILEYLRISSVSMNANF